MKGTIGLGFFVTLLQGLLWGFIVYVVFAGLGTYYLISAPVALLFLALILVKGGIVSNKTAKREWLEILLAIGVFVFSLVQNNFQVVSQSAFNLIVYMAAVLGCLLNIGHLIGALLRLLAFVATRISGQEMPSLPRRRQPELNLKVPAAERHGH